MNKVLLIGNLARDPELATTNSGISICRFSVAVNRRFQNSDGEREVDFFNIVVWRAQAENCHKFLRKGSKCAISGRLQTSSYDAQDGSKRYVTEVVADEVEFLGAKSGGEGREEFQGPKTGGGNFGGANASELEPIDDDSLPF